MKGIFENKITIIINLVHGPLKVANCPHTLPQIINIFIYIKALVKTKQICNKENFESKKKIIADLIIFSSVAE